MNNDDFTDEELKILEEMDREELASQRLANFKFAIANKNKPTKPCISDCSRSIYIILALFLGMLGIHNFYAKKFVRGIIQILCYIPFAYFVIAEPESTSIFSLLLIIPLLYLPLSILFDIIFVKLDGEGKTFK